MRNLKTFGSNISYKLKTFLEQNTNMDDNLFSQFLELLEEEIYNYYNSIDDLPEILWDEIKEYSEEQIINALDEYIYQEKYFEEITFGDVLKHYEKELNEFYKSDGLQYDYGNPERIVLLSKVVK
jgi:hypothetical protein